MIWEDIKNFLANAGFDLLRGLGILIVGFILVRWIMKLIERYEKKLKMEPTLKGFLKTVIRVLLYVLVIMTAANTMGIPLTSILTLFASAGVAVSLALQGVLTNLIGGLILLVVKPVRVGEYVKIGDSEGTITSVGIYYTEMNTIDNRHISLPNGSLTNTAIINYTREGTRRLDLVFSVSYNSDMDQVYKTLRAVAAEDSAVLADPAPEIVLSQCGNSSLDFTMKVWVKSSDYLPSSFRLLDSGKRALDQAHIEIPYPQMDVHIKNS